MTLRLITHLTALPIETLRKIYADVRLEVKEPEETSADFDADVLALANQDNLLQLKRKTVNRAIGMTYVVLNMLRSRPECQNCSHDDGLAAWLGMVAKHLNVKPIKAGIIIYNSVFPWYD